MFPVLVLESNEFRDRHQTYTRSRKPGQKQRQCLECSWVWVADTQCRAMASGIENQRKKLATDGLGLQDIVEKDIAACVVDTIVHGDVLGYGFA